MYVRSGGVILLYTSSSYLDGIIFFMEVLGTENIILLLFQKTEASTVGPVETFKIHPKKDVI